MTKQQKAQLTLFGKIAIHFGAVIPLIWLYYQWYTYALVDEINEMTRFTGKGGLIFLLLMMGVTPLITLSGWNFTAPWRKWLGMYAFGYITVHLLIFIIPIGGAEGIGGIIEETLRKRYAFAGFASWLIMLPLAITSNKFSQKRLKKNWKRLHKWVYATGVLAIIHYFWLVKAGNYRNPVMFGAILAVLFMLRIPAVRKAISTRRRNWQRRLKAAN